MSKSSYEEAIEILVNMGNGTIIEVIKALKQAQKQEKLLGLYRELITVKDELISMAYFGDESIETIGIERDLEKQIKELEK